MGLTDKIQNITGGGMDAKGYKLLAKQENHWS
jgi:hypothetical protein